MRQYKKGQIWLYRIGAGILEEIEITNCKGDYIQYKKRGLFERHKQWVEGAEFNNRAKALIKDVA